MFVANVQDLKMKMNYLAIVLVIIGGLNWGLYGLTQGRYDVVGMLAEYTHFHVGTVLYVAIGLAAALVGYNQFIRTY